MPRTFGPRFRWCGSAAVLCLLMTTGHAAAVVRYVDDDAPAGGDGQSWETAWTSLQDALAASTLGDEIRVAAGTYVPDDGAAFTPGDRGASFDITVGMSLLGGYAGLGGVDPDERHFTQYETVLSGDLAGNDGEAFFGTQENSFTIVKVPTSEAVSIEGFTVRGANHLGDPDRGGAMWLTGGGAPAVRSCVFRANRGWGGAAVIIDESSDPAFIDCVFIDNFSEEAEGAVALAGGGRPNFNRCIFRGNIGEFGAAIGSSSGIIAANSCLFEDNFARLHGGAVYISGFGGAQSVLNANRCTFRNNMAQNRGGAIYDVSAWFLVTNSLFASNAASTGGAIAKWTASPGPVATVQNCTMTGNTATSGGGAFIVLNFAGPVEVHNSIVRDNEPTNLAGQGAEYVFTFTNIPGVGGTGNINLDPLFVNAGSGSFRLLPDSPCVDAGTNSASVGPSDLDGRTRVVDGNGDGIDTVDMGAYEYDFLDCNRNGVDDGIDISSGAFIDCDGSGVPDVCELDGGADCDGDAGLDSCQLAQGLEDDCDGNGVLDTCDIAAGRSFDCDGNGIPDQCEVAGLVVRAYDDTEPFGLGAPRRIVLTDLQRTASDVVLAVEIFADFDEFMETVEVEVNGLNLGTVPAASGSTPCRRRADEFVIDAGTFNALASDGFVEVCLIPAPEVSIFDCEAPSVHLDLTYSAAGQSDCNNNGQRDECEILSGDVPDCNGNGEPDACDIAGGRSADIDGNGVPDECQDCDGSGAFDPDEIAAGELADCDTDGVPDGCQTSTIFRYATPAQWPFGFGVPATLVVAAPPPPIDTVELVIEAQADLSTELEVVDVFLNGTLVGRVFEMGSDCPPEADVEVFTMAPGAFTAIVGDADAAFELVPSASVNAELCNGLAFARLLARWRTADPDDLDDDGIPDVCECPTDLDADGVTDFGDLLLMLGAWGPCSGCGADLDENGAVDFGDLLVLIGAWGPCP